MGQIEIFNHLQYLNPFNCLQRNDLSNCIISVEQQYLKPFNYLQIRL